jgi:CRP-like cAMP-binding protein
MQAAAVSPPALELLRAFGSKPQWTQRGEVLIRAGEPGPNLLLLASGWACREHLRADGDQVLLDLYLPGDLIGLDNLVDKEALAA